MKTFRLTEEVVEALVIGGPAVVGSVVVTSLVPSGLTETTVVATTRDVAWVGLLTERQALRVQQACVPHPCKLTALSPRTSESAEDLGWYTRLKKSLGKS